MASDEWGSLEETLRETERDIAADPEAHGTTAEDWERVRQWPGETHPGNHIHIAERCVHGETKRTCEHVLEYARYRVRGVPCDSSFCASAPLPEEAELDGEG
jgi:hypothetical protein